MTVSPVILTLLALVLAAGGALVGGAIAWGRSVARLDTISATLDQHRAESAARDDARAAEQRAIAADVRAATETLARADERHGALAGRVDRLEQTDERHDRELRELRDSVASLRPQPAAPRRGR